MKIVLNKCYGGFGLSEKACEMLGVKYAWNIKRTDPRLVEVVETLGEEANGNFAELEIVEIPDEATDWDMQEYDGIESLIYVVNGKLFYH